MCVSGDPKQEKEAPLEISARKHGRPKERAAYFAATLAIIEQSCPSGPGRLRILKNCRGHGMTAEGVTAATKSLMQTGSIDRAEG